MFFNNEIYLRRKNKVNLLEGDSSSKLPKKYIASFLKNIESLGYTFSPDLINTLDTLDVDDVTDFYKEIVPILKKLRGAHVKFEPMYPNFPTQVMKMEEAELYINAIMHYLGDWFGVRILPKYDKEERFPLLDNVDLTVIDLGTDEEFYSIFTNLLKTNTSLSSTDEKDIEWAMAEGLSISLPATIPHKETLSLYAKLVIRHLPVPQHVEILSNYFKTATDVLRFATSLSDGDTSLATKTVYKSFTRRERKLLLELLNNCFYLDEDMFRHRGKWLRLGERLHPGDYKKTHPKMFKAFQNLRGGNKPETFNTLIESYLEDDKTSTAASLLAKRPGDFARRLDHLLRLSKRPTTIINKFNKVAYEVASPVLLQVMNHFENRNTQELRVVFPKGSVAKARVLENELLPLENTVCDRVVEVCKEALKVKFKELPELGNVFVDEGLKNFTVPFSQRSASKSLKTVSRGSRFKFPKGKTIRFFTYWKEEKGNRTDIDLSALMYDKDWNYKEHVSYTNLRSLGYKACHSGDITSAPMGACEFIDMDIKSVLKQGGRYIIMSVLSYTGQGFNTIPECFSGWMMRQDPGSGEIFEPKTVQDKMDLTAETTICLPVILDLKLRQVIWTDVALKQNPGSYNNVEGNSKGIGLMGRGFSELVKPNLHTLFTLHGEARGKIVEDKEEADTVFSLTEGTTPYDIEEIMSEYLS